MRWTIVGVGLGLQIVAVVFYCWFYWVARKVKPQELPNLVYRPIFKAPFIYLVLAGCFWVLGAISLIVFAFIDSDPVLLFFELFLIIGGVIVVRGFKV